MRKVLGSLFAFGLGVTCYSADVTQLDKDKTYTVPFTAGSPLIDGKFDEAAWGNALVYPQFSWERKPLYAPVTTENTTMRIMFDDKNLYLGFTCLGEPDYKPVATAPVDGTYDLRDDRVEFFFRGTSSEAAPYQFCVINCAGTVKGFMGIAGIYDGSYWYPKFQTAVRADGGTWNLEVKIPISELGKTSLSNELCLLKVERQHPAKGSSAIFPKGEFLKLFFEKPGENLIGIQSLTRGALSVDGAFTGENMAEFQVSNNSGKEAKVTLVIENMAADKTLGKTTKDFVLAPAAKEILSSYYEVSGKLGEKVNFSLLADKKVLYESGYDVEKINPFYRVYKLKDPLYEELFDKKTKKDPRLVGNKIWHMGVSSTAAETALLIGYPIPSIEQTQQTIKEMNAHFLDRGDEKNFKTASTVWSKYDASLGEFARMAWFADGVRNKGWQKVVFYAPYNIIGADEKGNVGWHESLSSGFLVDPLNSRAYIDASVATVKKYKDVIWGAFVGDEQFGQTDIGICQILREKLKDSAPDSIYNKINNEVKGKYGFGKYGIPYDLKYNDPTYPFSKRAFTLYINDKLRPVNMEFRNAIKAVAPEMPIISDDVMGNLDGELSSFSAYADIVPFQLTKPFGIKKQKWMFRTKLVKDISGLEYILPCPHEIISGYEWGACNVEEMVELYSQLFRGGATGINMWSASWGGGQAPAVNAESFMIGYPLAAKICGEILKQAKDLPPLKVPKADSLILLSENSTVYCIDARYPYDNLGRYEDLFAHIGVNARGWFNFASEKKWLEGREKVEDYPVIYLPDIKYSENAVLEKLLAYCKSGGTAIVLDPEAFEFNVDGSSMAEKREGLFGVKILGKEQVKTITFKYGKLNQTLPVLSQTVNKFEITDPNTKALASFDNGSPAVVAKAYGKGRLIFFSYLPVSEVSLNSTVWVDFWKEFHKELGCSVDNQIWRFKFPVPPLKQETLPFGYCLTNNYGFWYKYAYRDGVRNNMEIAGTYTLKTGSEALVTETFEKGSLTNRLRQVSEMRSLRSSGKKESRDFSAWGKVLKEGSTEISFATAIPVLLQTIKFFLNGEIKSLECYSSPDGDRWEKVGEMTGKTKTDEREVVELSVPLTSKVLVKNFKVLISCAGQVKLSEIELWGDCPELAGKINKK